VIQNEALFTEIFCFGNIKMSDQANHGSMFMMDVPTLGGGGGKPLLPKVLCGKAHCHDVKSTYQAKYLVYFDEFAAVNVPEPEGRMYRLTLKYRA
jgi:hypothetical protein